MNVLVLGSSGQIGGPLTTYLRSQSINVTEFDLRLNVMHDLRIKRNEYLVEMIQSNKIEFVVFLAYDVGGAKYLNSKQKNSEFISNNLKIMDTTFQILNEFRLKFIFASSQMSELKESTYGVLKNIGEKYTRAINGIPVRFWNIYGQEAEIEKFHVISDFIRMALESSEIRMMTNGKEKRDFLHADDCARAILRILRNYDEYINEEEIHIASHNWYSILEIAEIIAIQTGSKITPGLVTDESRLNTLISPNPKFKHLVEDAISLETGITNLITQTKSVTK